ncbi:glycosyltransferase family A protein [Cesiribacter sp. SM1]|uniref:glycosyltransferase family 2 protein n=1 Tax=Cesiribacter sp. SM1 TaxID=2861196 RepID=UPI001CD43C0E|nr:glycosyltransferase family A protein [Cesiribacter sp. SM1]
MKACTFLKSKNCSSQCCSTTYSALEKVPVLLPVRNSMATIRRVLDSLWQHTLQEFSVVLVNDGSTYATADILKTCTDTRLRVINLPPMGLPAALNEGLQHCTAPLVARMDACPMLCQSACVVKVAVCACSGTKCVFGFEYLLGCR